MFSQFGNHKVYLISSKIFAFIFFLESKKLPGVPEMISGELSTTKVSAHVQCINLISDQVWIINSTFNVVQTVERRRRDKINNWIVQLSKAIPDCNIDYTKTGQVSSCFYFQKHNICYTKKDWERKSWPFL